MQGTGFLYLLREAVRSHKLDVPGETLQSEHKYFHTHPFLINFIIGMWVKEYKDGGKPDFYKKVYSSAFGALGDSFFWHALRPVSFLLAALTGFHHPVYALIVYLLFFNLFHFSFLFTGYYIGLEMGRDIILFFNRIRFNRWPVYFDMLSAFLLGLLVALFYKSRAEMNIEMIFTGIAYLLIGLIVAKKVDIVIAVIINFLVSGTILFILGA